MPLPISSRRRFLLAAITFSTATVAGTTWLRGAAAWADDNDDATLVQFARLLFPIDALNDDAYGEVMNSTLSALEGSAGTKDALSMAENTLNSASAGDWYGADEATQIRAIESIQSEAYFAAILATVRGVFHYHPDVWRAINYPGSSKEHGGYLHRGFDDIDWLPEEDS